jgi:hypothetical protein
LDAAIQGAPDPNYAEQRLLVDMQFGARRYRYKRSGSLEWCYHLLSSDWFFLATRRVDTFTLRDQTVSLFQIEISSAPEGSPGPVPVSTPEASPDPVPVSTPEEPPPRLQGYQKRRIWKVARDEWPPDGQIPRTIGTAEASRVILAKLQPESRRIGFALPSKDTLERTIKILRALN